MDKATLGHEYRLNNSTKWSVGDQEYTVAEILAHKEPILNRISKRFCIPESKEHYFHTEMYYAEKYYVPK